MQRWWVVVVGVLGIGLAVLLIPRPDTGDDVAAGPTSVPTSGTATERAPGDDEAIVRPKSDNAMARPGSDRLATGGPVATGRVDGPNPLAEAALKKRNTPEALTAARISAPWTQVRRLMKSREGDSEAEAFAEEADSLVNDLRMMRRAPADWDFVEMESRMADLTKRIRASNSGDDDVERMLALVEERMVEYHRTKDTPPSEDG